MYMFIGSLHFPLISTMSPTVTVTQTTSTTSSPKTSNTATVHQMATPSVNPPPLRLSRQGT